MAEIKIACGSRMDTQSWASKAMTIPCRAFQCLRANILQIANGHRETGR